MIKEYDDIIELSPFEMMVGGYVGLQRQLENIQVGRYDDQKLREEDHWFGHIEGALGEIALSKYLNRYWSGIEKFGAVDVGFNHNVRTTRYNDGELRVINKDDDNKLVWLLVGKNGKYRVAGAILAARAKQPKYWRDLLDEKGKRKGQKIHNYWVPQSDLKFPEGTRREK